MDESTNFTKITTESMEAFVNRYFPLCKGLTDVVMQMADNLDASGLDHMREFFTVNLSEAISRFQAKVLASSEIPVGHTIN